MNQSISRRHFIQSGAAVSASALLMNPARAASERPNILWITSEDNGPHMGCYGDAYADTPNLDALARRGMFYQHAWSTAPVCAPARTTIISGMYPPCTGSEHMRSMTRLPGAYKMYPQYLREAGYYCTNNSKEDYNLEKTGEEWDESSRNAHWRNRAEGQPFFAIFNFTTTHESQIRKRPHDQVHDPAEVDIPAYHPDTPEVRQDWAQYHDKMTEMDAQAGKIMRQLEEDGLAENTIIMYYGDHGPGMPRGKRWPYNSGLHVPMLMYIPEKFKHLRPGDYQTGGSSDRLVGFIDLAPTVLSLAGIKPPEHMQGYAFAGAFTAPAPQYAHGFRGRMDERYDMLRVVRNERYIYMRNYMPHEIYGQRINYMFQTPTTQVWKRMYDEGKLEPPKTFFWETKPYEELYDLENDPDEVHNLADSPTHREVLNELRQAQKDHAHAIRDVGFLPESEIHSRSEGSTPFEMGHDDSLYPFERIFEAAEEASMVQKGEAELDELRNPQLFESVIARMNDSDSAVRYWAMMGVLMRGRPALKAAHDTVTQALKDDAPNVRVVAAEVLGRYGDTNDLKAALPVLESLASPVENGSHISCAALNAISNLGEKAESLKPALAKMERVDKTVHGRFQGYPGRLFSTILSEE